ncbi:unnamed protein product, partial [Hapterophycus canaliculatus]
RIVSVTSPPPPVPPPTSVRTAVEELRLGKRAVVPGRGSGLQATLCGKRGRRALRTSEGLSDEVKKRFPRQAEQAARLSAVEEQLDKRINRVRRKLLYKLEGNEWSPKCLRTWLSLEVTSTPKAQPQDWQQQQQQQQQPADGAQMESDGKLASQSSVTKVGATGAAAAAAAEGAIAVGTREDAGTPKAAGGTSSNGDSAKVVALSAEEKAGEAEREEEAEAEWFVLARLQGSLVGAPADGVERRFTSFFSRVVLELDGKAFPDVAAVEWVRSAGCEELHQVELKLPLAGCLSRGLRGIGVKAVLVARSDGNRPLRFTLSSPLCRTLRLTRRVETKSALLSAVCEALRRRGLLPGGAGDGSAAAAAAADTGEAGRGGGGGAAATAGGGAGAGYGGYPHRGGGGQPGGGIMLRCDPDLESVLGVSVFRFSQLEEALRSHLEPAQPSYLAAKISLDRGSAEETWLDVTVDTETPFQRKAAESLLGTIDADRGVGGGGVPLGQNGGELTEPNSETGTMGAPAEGRGGQRKATAEVETRPLGVPTVTEREAELQLGRQISYLVEAANSSGRRAAMLRALAESPLDSVPRLEAQMLADEEVCPRGSSS